ncbi:hypothetical protein Moror_12034 [Moniliophthora roreri MCA 2997]|uniref:Cyclase n=1 Tax=Moniliophthora roreri (strain MCA 2997) TaxID=1381753 RepID=V2XW72_MONRO|nr:hypothetical protein Moror_12034 [Moniliophthora roreri MCA 2997]
MLTHIVSGIICLLSGTHVQRSTSRLLPELSGLPSRPSNDHRNAAEVGTVIDGRCPTVRLGTDLLPDSNRAKGNLHYSQLRRRLTNLGLYAVAMRRVLFPAQAALLLTLVSASPVVPPSKLSARQFNSSDIYANWPSYDQLPLDPSYPTKAAWGVWGASDELGALNHITTDTIKAAKSEIEHGIAINLNLELDIPNPPFVSKRPPMTHAFLAMEGYQDDVITLNTQVSTQFDGLRHFPYSTDNNISTYQFYNDLITFDDIFGGQSKTLGIQNTAQKGIAGRAILLDWAGWKDSRGEVYDVFSNDLITVSQLDEVMSWQGIDPETFIHPGDFLIVRTGFMKQYSALPVHEQNVLPYEGNDAIGIEASEDTLRWIWEKKVGLVGADNPAFEVLPNTGTIIGGHERSLHQIFIAGWGLNIVEFLDLEGLTEECHKHAKYSFFFTIQNLNIAGGVASPPNALAIL